MTEQYIAIHWTCGSLDEARHLVQKRLVACANIIPWVESVFMWNNQLDVSQETKVIFKTTQNHFEEVKNTILKNAKYEVPEVSAFPIIEGNKEYLDWVSESLAENI